MGSALGKRYTETVDGGSLLPNGLYPTSARNYNHRTVRKMQLERRLAPFYKGVADIDEIRAESASECMVKIDLSSPGNNAPFGRNSLQLLGKRSLDNSTRKRNSTLTADARAFFGRHRRGNSHGWSLQGQAAANSLGNRSEKTKAYGGIIQLTKADLYRDALECPICFLYYPRNINYSRCCQQPICTECFLQINRADSDPTESPACPFCVEPNFGVNYTPPIVPDLVGTGAMPGFQLT